LVYRLVMSYLNTFVLCVIKNYESLRNNPEFTKNCGGHLGFDGHLG